MKRTAMITGAHGFIGRHVAQRFARAGHKVIGIGHGSWSDKELVEFGIHEWHTADITLDTLMDYAGEPDVLIHCAGSGAVSYSMTHPYQDFNRSVTTTASVLEYIRVYAPHCKLIYPSSAAVYGVAESLPINESDALHPLSPYGVHKLMAEELCKSYGNNFQISISIVRLFSIYGEGLRKQLLWDACSKASFGDNLFFGSGMELRDWLHVEDAAELMFVLSQSTDPGCTIANGGSGEGVPVRDVLTAVFEAYQTSSRPTFSGLPRPGDPPGYQAVIKLAQESGWTPRVSWREGVQRYVNWFLQECAR